MQIRDLLKFPYDKNKVTRLEVDILLSHVLKVPRSYLYLHCAENISEDKQMVFQVLMERRLQGEPLAYVLGNCEFWGLTLAVNNKVLIPRPETELLVEMSLQLLDKNQPLAVADLGTGSGAIALALARECRKWQIYATDNSGPALQLARHNARDLELTNIAYCLGDWCDALPRGQLAAIISNPPYIAINDEHVEEGVKKFEPTYALFSGDDGLDDLRKIIIQATGKLGKQGWLMLEHGFAQGENVRKLMVDQGFVNVNTHKDLSGHDRVTVGQL